MLLDSIQAIVVLDYVVGIPISESMYVEEIDSVSSWVSFSMKYEVWSEAYLWKGIGN